LRFKGDQTLFHRSSLIAALLIGLLLSAWCWLPSLAEISHVQMTAQTTGYFSYGNHFRGVDLVQPRLIFDYAATDGTTPFAMGMVQAALILAGVFVTALGWMRSKSTTRHSSFAILGLALSTWLITPLSRPLWDRLPPLQLVQFPWRLLSVQALFAALLIGALPSLTSPPMGGKEGGRGKGRRGWRWIAAAALAGLLAAAGLTGLNPEYLPIAADEITVERLQLYELFTGNIGSTIRYEWLPRWAAPRPFTGPALFDPDAPPRAIPLSGELVSAEETAHKPTYRAWAVEAGADGAEVAFPLYYWPGWRATVDNAPTETKSAPDSGYLTLTVPPGRHVVTMRLGRTPLRAVAEGISAATILALLAAVIASRRKTQDSKPALRPFVMRHAPFIICHLSFAILLALLVAFSPRAAPTGDTDLTMDFDRMPYLHHNPGGVNLDEWRLTGYHYSADRLSPGDTLRVTLDWETEREASATLDLVPPAAVRQDGLSAITATTAPITVGAGSATLELPIPRTLGPGLYLIRLRSGEREVYLRPIWVGEGEAAVEKPTSAAFADGVMRLHDVDATQTTPGQLDLRLVWSAANPIAANYKLSLRLTDPAGNEWARLDTQPGYGFLPTSLWPAGRLVHDRYTLALPAGIPPGDSYALAVIVYRAATEETLGEHAFPISLGQVTMRPDAPVVARFGDELALSRLEVPERVRQGEGLGLAAYWLAVEQPSSDYAVEWRLEAAEQTISATLPLAPGSPPTAWPVGAWIAGRTALPIPSTTLPGEYTLSLTLRDPTGGTSLGTYTHPRPVRVQERERTWKLPEMQREVGARFGDRPGGTIELAGYDLRQEGDTLKLTLHWQALAVPDRHSMLFVHLADPATGWPVAQVDTMPRAFAYPTGMWAPGEVVSDEVTLLLKDVPAGQYELAVGWYDPGTSTRLPVTDGEGNPLPGDRLILPDGVTLP
jgi:hypothetical protein